MSGRAQVVWDEAMTRYDFGPAHPMSPIRLDLTMRLAESLGVLQNLQVVEVDSASDETLRMGHSQAYIDSVRRCGVVPHGADLPHGLGTPDVPTFTDMHDIAARIAQATVEAADSVWSGRVDHAFNPAGGLHHAMRETASGFCVYNDLSIAINSLLGQGVERVAYVDIDVHHGDGVEAAFWNDPRVLTISIHEGPQTLFPGTGWPADIGGNDAAGYAVNVALPIGTDDEQWLRALHSVVPQLLGGFDPQVLVTQHGCDSHVRDPLANLAVSIDGQRTAAEQLHRWADEFAAGKWVATGGGGYAIVDVVPRTWSLLMAELSGSPLDPQTPVPETWREYALLRTGLEAPVVMTDGKSPRVTDWSSGYDPDDAIDKSILSTRRAVFPHHGLDPERD
jgi:acetoin utilization protein AcuC